MTTRAHHVFDANTVNGLSFLGREVPFDFTPTFTALLNTFDVKAGADLGRDEALLLNNGTILGAVTGFGDADIAIANVGTIGLDGIDGTDILLTGTGQRFLFNEGKVFGDIQFGTGQDVLVHNGTIAGDVRMGGGDDVVAVLTNTVPPGPPNGLDPAIKGMLNTGTGNDLVINEGILDRVILGGGNDLYLADTAPEGQGVSSFVSGGAGADTLRGSAADERLVGGEGCDVISGNDGNDRIDGGGQADWMEGGVGNDRIIGRDGKDTLEGGDGNDRLHAGSGEDVLIGGRGNDVMTGGSGADEFILRSGQSFGNIGNDKITDLSDDDTIVLYPNVFTSSPGGPTPLVTDDLVLSQITYFGGGRAVLDMDALYEITGLVEMRDSSITFLNVHEGDITADSFFTGSDFVLI